MIAFFLSALLSADAVPDMPMDYRADPQAIVASARGATSARFPDADSVMIDDRIHVAYNPDGSEVTWDDEWVKVLTEKGRRANATVTLDYSARYGDVGIFAVEIVGTNGQIRAVDFRRNLKTATDNSGLGSNIVDPLDRKLSCAVPGLAVGEIRHVRFMRRTIKPRMKGTWADAQLFEYTVPILSTVYTVDQPDANPVRHAVVRHPFGKTVVRAPDCPLGNGRTLLRWDVRDVPQAFPEPNMPPLSTCVQSIRLSTAPDWPTVSRWYWNLCAPHLAASSPAMTNKVNALIAACTTREAKIRALFKFVSQEIRYMGLTLESDAPGYEPHDVKTTFDNRYGVCRDKAALLAQMLRIAGIPAYPVLIHAGAKMDPEIPLPWFNHAIVAVGNTQPSVEQYLLMDPTDESTRDLFPAYLSDRSYLVARPEGETLRVSPVQPVAGNMLAVDSEGTLAAEGALLLTSRFAFDGINDTALRHTFLKRTPEERRRLFEGIFRRIAPGAELLSLELLPADLRDTETRLTAKTVTRLPEAVLRGKTRDEFAVPFVTRAFSVAAALLDENTSLENRRFPLKLSTTAGTRETLKISLGDAVGDLLSLPAPSHAEARGRGEEGAKEKGVENFSFDLNYACTNGTLSATRALLVKDVNFDVPAYNALRNARKDAESAERASPLFRTHPYKDANLRWISDRTVTHLASPTSWVTTNTVVREVLTYKGKKSAAELRFTYAPSTRGIEVVDATVSNRSGKVFHVTPKEINLMDASWAASAPRYPASKILVVNLPGVEIGSVIRTTVVRTVTNAPVAYSGLFTFGARDPEDYESVELHVPAGMRFASADSKVSRVSKDSKDLKQDVVYASHWAEGGTTCHLWRVRAPSRIPNEPSQPALSQWRPYASVSAADWREHGTALLEALARARAAGADDARRLGRSLAASGVAAAPSPSRAADVAAAPSPSRAADVAAAPSPSRAADVAAAPSPSHVVQVITAIRRHLAHHLRVAGPGIFDLPFDQAFSAPDRALADGYASSADRMNLIYAMCEGAGLDPDFVLATDDAQGFRGTEQKRRAMPKPLAFDTLLVRVVADGRAYWIGGENEYTPPEATSREGDSFYDPRRDVFGVVSVARAPAPGAAWWAPWTWFGGGADVPAPAQPSWKTRAENVCRMTVRENGAVDFDVTNRLWGAGVGTFRKRYAEMLPELRNRHQQELVGQIAQNATATREFETDVVGYPAALSLACYVPEYAVAKDGAITLRIPDFETAPFSLGGPERKSPIQVSGATEVVDVYEIVFPAGYTKIEHLPRGFSLRNPADTRDEWLTYTVSSRIVDNCLHVTLRRRARRAKATKLSADFFPFLRDWNRRATSLEGRTVTVRKDKN